MSDDLIHDLTGDQDATASAGGDDVGTATVGERRRGRLGRPLFDPGAVVHWLCGIVVTVVVTWFALLLITGHYVDEGPVLIQLTHAHGLHEGDLFVLVGWLLVMGTSITLVATSEVPGRRGRVRSDHR